MLRLCTDGIYVLMRQPKDKYMKLDKAAAILFTLLLGMFNAKACDTAMVKEIQAAYETSTVTCKNTYNVVFDNGNACSFRLMGSLSLESGETGYMLSLGTVNKLNICKGE